MNINLSPYRALVCGASRGIGRACAESLAAQGAGITALARDDALLAALVDALPKSTGPAHEALAIDLTNTEQLSRLVQASVADKPAQILVNNAGGPPPGPVLDASGEDFLAAMRAHLLANQQLVQQLLPGMRQAGYGRIINIISTSVYEPIAGLGVSNTVRAAVAAWAKTLSAELGGEGITVNNVLPGFTATDRLASLIGNRARKSALSEEQVAAQMRASVPLGRFAEASEIASAVAFLASPAASYISGVSLAVDGGRLKSL